MSLAKTTRAGPLWLETDRAWRELVSAAATLDVHPW
jgi:hypothetical protein